MERTKGKGNSKGGLKESARRRLTHAEAWPQLSLEEDHNCGVSLELGGGGGGGKKPIRKARGKKEDESSYLVQKKPHEGGARRNLSWEETKGNCAREGGFNVADLRQCRRGGVCVGGGGGVFWKTQRGERKKGNKFIAEAQTDEKVEPASE